MHINYINFVCLPFNNNNLVYHELVKLPHGIYIIDTNICIDTLDSEWQIKILNVLISDYVFLFFVWNNHSLVYYIMVGY